MNGNLKNMIWLKNAGCSFDEYTVSALVVYSIKNKEYDTMIIKWLLSNGCEWGIIYPDYLNIIKQNKWWVSELWEDLCCPWEEIREAYFNIFWNKK